MAAVNLAAENTEASEFSAAYLEVTFLAIFLYG
jgi:hypothetical protein